MIEPSYTFEIDPSKKRHLEKKILRQSFRKACIWIIPIYILVSLYLALDLRWGMVALVSGGATIIIGFFTLVMTIVNTTEVVQSTYTVNERGLTRHGVSDFTLSWPDIRFRQMKDGDLSFSKPKLYLSKPTYRKNEIVIYSELKDFDRFKELAESYGGLY